MNNGCKEKGSSLGNQKKTEQKHKKKWSEDIKRWTCKWVNNDNWGGGGEYI